MRISSLFSILEQESMAVTIMAVQIILCAFIVLFNQ